LQGVQTEIRQVGDGLAGGVDGEHATFVARGLVEMNEIRVSALRRHGAMLATSHPDPVPVIEAPTAGSPLSGAVPERAGQSSPPRGDDVCDADVDETLDRQPVTAGHPDAGGFDAGGLTHVEYGGETFRVDAHHHA
jgi:hypothetical protein